MTEGSHKPIIIERKNQGFCWIKTDKKFFYFLIEHRELNQDLKETVRKRIVGENILEIKVVGDKKIIDFLKTIFRITKCEQKYIERDEFYLIYDPNTGAIRLKKDEKATVVSIKSSETNAQKKVLIVDDSKTIRTILEKIIGADPNFKIVGSLENPLDVADCIEKQKPDVITLDIHMPHMNGVELLKKVISKAKIPTIMISSISLEEGPLVLEALESGAVDYIQKPKLEEIGVIAPVVLEKLKVAAAANTQRFKEKKRVVSSGSFNKDELICIGSSTGGTEALREVLTHLPDSIPPILIVQHIPAVFSKAFADRMNSLCNFEVKEAEDGDLVQKNRVLLAPGGKQMKVKWVGKDLVVAVTDDAAVNRFKPSVDYLFDSIAAEVKSSIIGIILTGMGKDGAQGLLKLKNLGAQTIAQNEESCVVYGMPREAVEIGAALHVCPLDEIADKILSLSANRTKKAIGH